MEMLQQIKMATHTSSRNISNIKRSRTTNANAEVMLSSFASLLSSAVTNGVNHPLVSSEDPTLSRLLSVDPKISNTNSNAPSLVFPGLALASVNGHKADDNRQSSSSSNIINTPNSSSSSSSSQPSSIQNVAAHSLASPIAANLSTIDAIPSHLLQNLTASLKRLIDSRMRSSLAALRHTMKDGIDDSIMKLLLVTLDPIRITTVVTSFTVVATSADGLITPQTQERGASVVEEPKSITLPLILEAIIDAKVLGKMANLTLQAPGTISGTIHPTNSLLTSVSVSFDTMALLKSMMSQARIVVKKGIRQAACISTNFKKNAALGGVMGGFMDHKKRLQSLQRPALSQTNRDNSNATSTSKSSSSSKPTPTSSSVMQEKLLTSYPNHLRQTVEHFLPASENADSVSIEGFPSHLAKTLLSLSRPKSDSSYSSGNGSRVSSSGRGSSSEGSDLSDGKPRQELSNEHQQSNNNHGIHNDNRNTANTINTDDVGGNRKRQQLHQNNFPWIQNVPVAHTSSSITTDSNSKNKNNTNRNQNAHNHIHWANVSQHIESSSQGQHMVGPSSTSSNRRTMGLNSTGLPIAYNSNGTVTNNSSINDMSTSNISDQHYQFLQQHQHQRYLPSPKRQRTSSGSDGSSYSEKEI